jgi:ABC-2 type transport system ATP-binding protein
MTGELAVEATGLEKSFGAVKVLCGVDLGVERGSVVALLGPNGAGKTTTVRILATLLRADAGQARVAGLDVVGDRRRVRRAISLTGQYAALDELQTGQENLRMMGRLSGLPGPVARRRARELLQRFDLADAGDRQGRDLVGRDAPAAGPGGQPGRRAGRAVPGRAHHRAGPARPAGDLAGRRRPGRVGRDHLLTTQYLEEADRLADRIALLDGGRVVAEGTATQLKRRVADQRLDLVLADAAAFDQIAHYLGGRAVRRDSGRLTIGVATDGSAAQVRALLDEVDPDRRAVARFAVHTATLDDVFLALTGRTAGRPENDKETADV